MPAIDFVGLAGPEYEVDIERATPWSGREVLRLKKLIMTCRYLYTAARHFTFMAHYQEPVTG